MYRLNRTIEYIVDDRTFLLGLGELYRETIKPRERSELLACARSVASVLNVHLADVPVEGYYAEDARLTEYFLIMRGLQEVDARARPRVEDMAEFRRLSAVTSSPIYGTPVDDGRLLPRARDALSQALAEQYPDWSLQRLIDRAQDVAAGADDCSLVGLAVLSRDAVVVTALRESVVLYAMLTLGGDMDPPNRRYIWRVTPLIAERARRFIDTFNALFREQLPRATPENAEEFHGAAKQARLTGRCVAIGATPGPDRRYYHWAITSQDGEWGVEEFWDHELWTTERYRRHSALRDLPPELRERFRQRLEWRDDPSAPPG